MGKGKISLYKWSRSHGQDGRQALIWCFDIETWDVESGFQTIQSKYHYLEISLTYFMVRSTQVFDHLRATNILLRKGMGQYAVSAT